MGCCNQGGKNIRLSSDSIRVAKVNRQNGIGPGSQLLSIMPAYAKLYAWMSLENCGCEEYAAQMDVWGVPGCVERREEIVSHLVSKAPAFLQRLHMTTNRAELLVNEAITLAVEAMPKYCKCGRRLKNDEGPICYWCANKERLAKR